MYAVKFGHVAPDFQLTDDRFYRVMQGILVCVCGLGMLVVSDQLTGKDYEATDKVKGDLFMLAGATLYGICLCDFLNSLRHSLLTSKSLANSAEEFFVRRSPLYEVVGQLGMWGTLINGIQAAGLEYKDMMAAPWNGPIGEFHFASSQSHGLKRRFSWFVTSLHRRSVHFVHDGSDNLSVDKLCVL